MNPYEVLGVKPTATLKEIKKAFRKLSKQYHPDKGGEAQLFIEVQNAYDILSDPDMRARFDKDGDLGDRNIPLATAGRNIIIQMWESILDEKEVINNEESIYSCQIDLPNEFIKKLNEMKEALIKNRTKAELSINTLKEIREKLIYLGKDTDYLTLTIQHRIDNNNSNIKAFSRRLDEIEAAKEIANDYDYDRSSKTKDDCNRSLLGDGLLKGFGL